MYGGYTKSNGSVSITVPQQGVYLVIIQHMSNNNDTAMYIVRKTSASGYYAIILNEHITLTINNVSVDMDITITKDNSGSALVSLISLNSFTLFNKLPNQEN